MDASVVEATIVLPNTKASSFSVGYKSNKPRAQVRCKMSEGESRTVWTPVRVARVLAKNMPSFPCELDDFKRCVQVLENKVALTMVAEMIERRDHSSDEVRQKLFRYGFSTVATDAAVSRAQELRFLDDNRFSRYFIEERKRRGWGQRKIERELKLKGISPESIPGYPEEFFSVDDDFERAYSLVQKKRVPDQRAFEKLVRFLMAKGFGYSVAADVVKRYLSSE